MTSIHRRFMCLIIFAALILLPRAALHAAPPSKPNVLIILADDMGYSDAGCYGGEIRTPNLDALAKGGVRFTQFYNTARCWPSRGALLTGYYAQAIRRDAITGGKSGFGGIRPVWAPLLPDMLKPLGYRCYHSGKWHVDGKPLANGFDHSYIIHDTDRHFSPHVHVEDGKDLPPVPPGSGYYSSTPIASHAIKCLKDHAEKHADQPFFEYLAFIAPHFPLHAPAEDVARYKDRYAAGWEVLREERWRRMQAMNIGGNSISAPERKLGPPVENPESMKKLSPDDVTRPILWADLTEAQRSLAAGKMAVHAAMIDRMDQEIGRVLDQLRAMNALDNTIILFLSDNGASAEMWVRGDGNDPAAAPGSAKSFLSLGPGWSTVSNTPFRRHKTWVHEGGIATPLIAHWPAGIAARGELRDTPGHVIDIVPTLLEIVGGKRADTIAGKPAPPAHGKSLVPLFAKDGSVTRESLWWMHLENRALRVGDWKIVAAGKNAPWELYDLSTDRAEMKDLATEKPEKVVELAKLWTAQYEEYSALARKNPPPPSVRKPGQGDDGEQPDPQKPADSDKKDK